MADPIRAPSRKPPKPVRFDNFKPVPMPTWPKHWPAGARPSWMEHEG